MIIEIGDGNVQLNLGIIYKKILSYPIFHLSLSKPFRHIDFEL